MRHKSSKAPLDNRGIAGMALLMAAIAVLVLPGLAIMAPAAQTSAPDVADGEHVAVVLGNLTADAGTSRPGSPIQGQVVTFNGSKSTDTVAITNYTWNFTDDKAYVLWGQQVAHQFMKPGVYVVTLTVRDVDDNVSTDQLTVTVSEDLRKPIAAAGVDQHIKPGESRTVTLNGSMSTDNAFIANYTWYFLLNGKDNIYLYGEEVQYTFEKTGHYLITLYVRDAGGNEANATMNLYIESPPNFITLYWQYIILAAIGAFVVMFFVSRLRRGLGLITKTDIEKGKLAWKNFKKTWKIFKANRLGMAGLVILLAFVVLAVFAPLLSTVHDPWLDVETNHPDISLYNPMPPSFSPSPYTGFVHPFGTDSTGMDVYTMTIYGTRASLEVGFVATMISIILGTLVGLGAGYFGRIWDESLMRLTDFFLVLPWFPLMIVVMAVLGPKFIWVILVIGMTSWPSTARVVRSQVLTVKERQFIVRAKAIGAGDGHIIRTHIIPNVMPLIFANTVLLIATAIFSESFLDFFGLGDPSVISWGTMLEKAYDQSAFLVGAWWWIAAPGVAIVIMVLAFSLVGYAIDDVLNPKLRKR